MVRSRRSISSPVPNLGLRRPGVPSHFSSTPAASPSPSRQGPPRDVVAQSQQAQIRHKQGLRSAPPRSSAPRSRHPTPSPSPPPKRPQPPSQPLGHAPQTARPLRMYAQQPSVPTQVASHSSRPLRTASKPTKSPARRSLSNSKTKTNGNKPEAARTPSKKQHPSQTKQPTIAAAKTDITNKSAELQAHQYAVGDRVEYWCKTKQTWVTSFVTVCIGSEGHVVVGEKPHVWISLEDQPSCLRRAPSIPRVRRKSKGGYVEAILRRLGLKDTFVEPMSNIIEAEDEGAMADHEDQAETPTHSAEQNLQDKNSFSETTTSQKCFANCEWQQQTKGQAWQVPEAPCSILESGDETTSEFEKQMPKFAQRMQPSTDSQQLVEASQESAFSAEQSPKARDGQSTDATQQDHRHAELTETGLANQSADLTYVEPLVCSSGTENALEAQRQSANSSTDCQSQELETVCCALQVAVEPQPTAPLTKPILDKAASNDQHSWKLANMTEHRVISTGLRRLHSILLDPFAAASLLEFPKRADGSSRILKASFFRRLLSGFLEIQGCLQSDITAAHVDLRYLSLEQLLAIRKPTLDFQTNSDTHNAHSNFIAAIDRLIAEQSVSRLLPQASSTSQADAWRLLGNRLILILGATELLREGWCEGPEAEALTAPIWALDLDADSWQGHRFALFHTDSLRIDLPSSPEMCNNSWVRNCSCGKKVAVIVADKSAGLGNNRRFHWKISLLDPSVDDVVASTLAVERLQSQMSQNDFAEVMNARLAKQQGLSGLKKQVKDEDKENNPMNHSPDAVADPALLQKISRPLASSRTFPLKQQMPQATKPQSPTLAQLSSSGQVANTIARMSCLKIR
jgi:hypothetical protein